MTYYLSALAEEDLRAAWGYLADEAGEGPADQMLAGVFDRALMLTRHPRAGRLRADIESGIRSFPVGSYVIYYRVENEDVPVDRPRSTRASRSGHGLGKREVAVACSTRRTATAF